MVAYAFGNVEGITVGWTAPALGADRVLSYTVYRADGLTGSSVIATVDATTHTFFDAAGSLSSSYSVGADMADGGSASSNAAIVVLAMCPLIEPSSIPPYFMVHPECIVCPMGDCQDLVGGACGRANNLIRVTRQQIC